MKACISNIEDKQQISNIIDCFIDEENDCNLLFGITKDFYDFFKTDRYKKSEPSDFDAENFVNTRFAFESMLSIFPIEPHEVDLKFIWFYANSKEEIQKSYMLNNLFFAVIKRKNSNELEYKFNCVEMIDSKSIIIKIKDSNKFNKIVLPKLQKLGVNVE